MPFALPPCFCYWLDTPSAFTLSQWLLCSSARLLRRRKYRYHMGVTAWLTAYLGVQPCSCCVRHIVLIKSVLVCWLVFSLTFSDVLVTSDVCFGFLLLFIFFESVWFMYCFISMSLMALFAPLFTLSNVRISWCFLLLFACLSASLDLLDDLYHGLIIYIVHLLCSASCFFMFRWCEWYYLLGIDVHGLANVHCIEIESSLF